MHFKYFKHLKYLAKFNESLPLSNPFIDCFNAASGLTLLLETTNHISNVKLMEEALDIFLSPEAFLECLLWVGGGPGCVFG